MRENLKKGQVVMRTSSKSDFFRWLDEKVLGQRAHLIQVEGEGEGEPDAAERFSRPTQPVMATLSKAAEPSAIPVCLNAIGAAGYAGGFRERKTLQASFQIVQVEGLHTLDKGPCTVTFHRAVEDSFDGRPALRVRVFTHSFGGRMGCMGEFSEVRQLYYNPLDYALLGWELGDHKVRLHAAAPQPELWVVGRSYPLGSRTVYHRDGHPIESFVERGEVSVTPQLDYSLALRSYAVDDASDQSSVLELYEFSVEAGRQPYERLFRTKSHNICAVRENLAHGTVLQMTMIRCT
jgi:hypothetical protein